MSPEAAAGDAEVEDLRRRLAAAEQQKAQVANEVAQQLGASAGAAVASAERQALDLVKAREQQLQADYHSL